MPTWFKSPFVFFGFLTFSFLASAEDQKKTWIIPSKTIVNFEKYNVGQFPTSFKTWPFQRGDAKQVYRIQQEGANKYLEAADRQGFSEQIFKEFDWKINLYPYFKWRWRAHTLPVFAAENRGDKNDSVCGVYVVFGRTTGTALKFTWSTTLPPGTVFEKKPGKMVIQVLESGKKHINQWRHQTIHIPSTYEKLLKHPMKRIPSGFAILTDGNATHSEASCDYDDFQISSTP